MAGLADQIEIARGRAARVSAVVHAEQTHDFERNGTHRHQGGELHAAVGKPALQTDGIQLRHPVAAQHAQRQRLVKPGQLTIGQPVLQRCQQLVQHTLVCIVFGFEKAFHQGLHLRHPIARCAVGSQRVQTAVHVVQPLQQAADDSGIESAHAGLGHRVLPQRVQRLRPEGIAQQQAA